MEETFRALKITLLKYRNRSLLGGFSIWYCTDYLIATPRVGLLAPAF